jgi:hypothetical protein
MLLVRLALSCVLPHGFAWYLEGFVPKLFPSFAGLQKRDRQAREPQDDFTFELSLSGDCHQTRYPYVASGRVLIGDCSRALAHRGQILTCWQVFCVAIDASANPAAFGCSA